MIDHVILTVSDFKRSVAFYAKALKPLGITNFTGSRKGSPIPRRCMLGLQRKTMPRWMPSTKRRWPPAARARKPLRLGPNTILATMRHGCSILTATISRSFIKAEFIFIALMLNGDGSPFTKLASTHIFTQAFIRDRKRTHVGQDYVAGDSPSRVLCSPNEHPTVGTIAKRSGPRENSGHCSNTERLFPSSPAGANLYDWAQS
jgi:hypothetical protein